MGKFFFDKTWPKFYIAKINWGTGKSILRLVTPYSPHFWQMPRVVRSVIGVAGSLRCWINKHAVSWARDLAENFHQKRPRGEERGYSPLHLWLHWELRLYSLSSPMGLLDFASSSLKQIFDRSHPFYRTHLSPSLGIFERENTLANDAPNNSKESKLNVLYDLIAWPNQEPPVLPWPLNMVE